jgi:type IV pilus assembly protein PilW
MMNSLPAAGRRRQAMLGFTLVELMVSVAIGLILLLFLSSLYFNSRSSSRLNDDNARMQEDGRYAMGLIGRNLMQAGFGYMQTGNSTDFPPADLKSLGLQGLMGCTDGFAEPMTAIPPTCAAAGSSAFMTSYTSEPYDASKSDISGAGTDCSGTPAVGATVDKGGIVINRFYVGPNKTLYCKGNAGAEPQPILSNVEKMLVTYGIDTESKYAPLLSTTDAAIAGADEYNGSNNKAGWDRVVTATVCLEIRSANKVVTTGAGQTYLKCDGSSFTSHDGLLRTVMTRVFTLRNNATASLGDN